MRPAKGRWGSCGAFASQRVKIRRCNSHPLFGEASSDLELHQIRHAALAPLAASGFSHTKSFRLSVNQFPIKSIVVHATMMGQIVPTVKDNVSRDQKISTWHNRAMNGWLNEGEFDDQLCARVQRLRLERGWNQRQTADAIGVSFDRYKKYETRSPMPHYLIPRFAQIMDRSIAYIMTGKDDVVAARRERRLIRTTEYSRDGTNG